MKKIATILLAVVLLFSVLLLLYFFPKSNKQNDNESITGEEKINQEDFDSIDLSSQVDIKIITEDLISQRIEDFTIRYLSDTETVEATYHESDISVSVSLFLETDPKLIIKEAIYEDIANHALHIIRFFPEVNNFNYSVWEGNPKHEVITITLDDNNINTLEPNFSKNTNKKDNGIETAFIDIFSTAIERKAALSWKKDFDISIKLNEVESNIEKEVIINRIESFSKRYFRHLETAQAIFENGDISVSVSFVPSVGSFPIKEDIYEEIVNHALRVIKFFPEVNFFTYIVLWQNDEVITLTIEKEDIKWLENNWFTSLTNRNGGFKTTFVDCFTTVEIVGDALRWREVADHNTVLP